jgi:hypothetical protein
MRRVRRKPRRFAWRAGEVSLICLYSQYRTCPASVLCSLLLLLRVCVWRCCAAEVAVDVGSCRVEKNLSNSRGTGLASCCQAFEGRTRLSDCNTMLLWQSKGSDPVNGFELLDKLTGPPRKPFSEFDPLDCGVLRSSVRLLVLTHCPAWQEHEKFPVVSPISA